MFRVCVRDFSGIDFYGGVDAQYWEEEGETHGRNQNLARIDSIGRTQWKQESGYHRRSNRGDSDVSLFQPSLAILVLVAPSTIKQLSFY